MTDSPCQVGDVGVGEWWGGDKAAYATHSQGWRRVELSEE